MEIYALSIETPSYQITNYKLTRHGEHLYWERCFLKGGMSDALINCLSSLGWWSDGPTVEKVKIAAEHIGSVYLGDFPSALSIVYKEGDI